jgi:glucuronosyltransferase
MTQTSLAFRDRPMSALDTALYWTEYVLRHDDTHLLRPSSIQQSWWKRRNLDIHAILFLSILALIKLLLTIVKFLQSYTKTNKLKLN